MNTMYVQVIAGILILLLGLYIFKSYPLKTNSREMILASMFVILALVIALFSIRLPLFGFDSLRIGFTQIILVIGGALIVPSCAFIMGIVYDLLGLLISPSAFPFLGFTLGNILVCVIPSIWYHSKYLSDLSNRCKFFLLISFLLTFNVFSLVYIIVTNQVKINSAFVYFELWMKVGLGGFCTFAVIILILSLYLMKNKLSGMKFSILINVSIIVLLIEFCIQFGCTPIWMQVMYGIPWGVSLILRIVKACIMIPLNIFVGYSIMISVNKYYLQENVC